jgi:hypothetical protein
MSDTADRIRARIAARRAAQAAAAAPPKRGRKPKTAEAPVEVIPEPAEESFEDVEHGTDVQTYSGAREDEADGPAGG